VGVAAQAVRWLSAVAAGCALVVAIFVFRDGDPDGGGDWVAALIVLVLVSWPAVVLFVLSGALRALAELPERLRTTPAEARSRGEELRLLAERIRAVRGSRLVRLPFLLFRFARVAGGSRELLGPHVGALPLVSVPFLILSAAAIVAIFVLVPVALVLLVILAAS
jgi:hypothetical protein